jgi:hypothetical protein
MPFDTNLNMFFQPQIFCVADLAVSSEGRLDLLKDGHSVITLSLKELYQARGLVYLPKRDVFLFSNSNPSVETSIYALKVNTTHINSSKIFPLIEAGIENSALLSKILNLLISRVKVEEHPEYCLRPRGR